MNDLDRTSRTLSYWLRHAPEAGGLQLDGEGWALAETVLRALGKANLPCTSEHLASVVAANQKNRFELSASGDRIRARQGHSLAVEAGWVVQQPPEQLFHGTVERSLTAIFTQGLVRKARHHVHLSTTLETARQVGARRGRPVVIEVASGRMWRDGLAFYLSSNGIWLTDHAPSAYLRRLQG